MKTFNWCKALAIALICVAGAFAQTYQILVGTTYSGNITTTNSSQRYTVVLPMAGKLFVNIASPGGTTALPNLAAEVKWFNSSNSQIKTTSGGFNFPYNDSMEVSAGTYHIEIIQRSGVGYTGLYNIRIDCTINESASNNTNATAQLLPAGYTVRGSITASDVDRYKYVLTEPGRLSVNLTKGTLSWAYIRWYNADGAQIASSSFSGNDSYSVYMNLEAGTYYIGVEQYASSYTGTYTLKGNFAAAGNNETEPNNTTTNAQTLTPSQTVKGFISYQDGTDTYKYVLTEPGKLTVNMTHGTLTSYGYIRWYNAGDTLIAEDMFYNDDNYNAYMNLEAGTYYIRVANCDKTGTYFLKSNFAAAGNNETEPNETRPNAQLLTSGQTVKGFISYQDGTDMYRYVLTEAGKLKVNVTWGTLTPSFSNSVYIRWYKDDGSSMKNTSHYYSSAYSDSMNLEAGTYYIGVVKDGNTGTYNLTAYTGTTAPTTAVTGVTVSPLNASMQPGFTQTFSATVAGTNTGYVQGVTWSLTGNNNSGTTISNSGLLTIADSETATSLTVKATSTSNTSVSGTITVAITYPPIITAQPEDGTTTMGATHSLSVTTSGSAPLSYQWYYDTTASTANSKAISNATHSSYTVPTTAIGTLYYYVKVSNSVGSVTSRLAQVVVNVAAPTITVQPTSGTVVADGTRSLSVTATTGGGTLSYRWYRNTTASNTGGTVISGATNSSYSVPTSTPGIFYYYVVVTNSGGSVTSNVVTITVNPSSPTISTQPSSDTATVGTARTVSVSASVPSGGSITYQWYSNTRASNSGGTLITGATSSSYTISSSTEIGLYYHYVIITNTQNSLTATTTSSVATTTINPPTPTISTQPLSDTVTAETGAYLTISVSASVPTGGLLSYQWYSNTNASTTGGTAIDNATNSELIVPTNTAGAYYRYVVVTNTQGGRAVTAVSDISITMVNPEAPIITTQPAGCTVVPIGGDCSLSVTAVLPETGGSLSYQWYRNASESTVEGTAVGTDLSYNAPTSASGLHYYYVVVTNTQNNITAADTSDIVSVTVKPIAAEMPVISEQPSDSALQIGEPLVLSVAANVSDNGLLSYQWYSNTTASNSGGDMIEGEEASSYSVPTSAAGIYYYYAVVTNTNDDAIEDKTVSVVSDVAVVNIAPLYIVTFNATGGEVEYESGITGIDSTLASLPIPVKNGYTFNGWFTEETDGEEVTTSTVFDGSITIYAQWTRKLNSALPTITTQPVGGTADAGESYALTVSASIDDEGELSYQWYRNISARNTGGAPVSGATESSYIPSTKERGTFYYYVVVTNTNEHAAENKTAAIASNAVTLSVNGAGTGTADIFTEGFESANDWVLVNGSQTNYWTRGTATYYDGLRSFYITNNGSANSYSSTSTATHIYKDITFPTSSSNFTMTFYFKGVGESNFDYMRVNYGNTSISPVAGIAAITNATLAGTYNQNSSWTLKSISLPASEFSGKTMRIVFTWVNDGSINGQPPAAIDNIVISVNSGLPIHTVNFNLNDGTGTTPADIAIVSGNRLSAEQNPSTAEITKTGYVNDGKWYIDPAGNTEFVFGYNGTVILSNWTLYPKWFPSYTVTFNAEGGIVATANAATVFGDTLTSLPTPTRTGYTFDGWFTADTSGTQVTTSTVFSTDTTIYAQWTPTNYTITYTLNNGTVEPINPENYTVETDTITLNNPVRTGYTFTGWTGDNGTTPQTSVSIAKGSTGNKSYTANWTLNVYTVIFNANGGTVTTLFGTTSNAWKLTSLPTPTRTGYTFNGWFTADTSGTQVTTSTVFSANTTIYAQWTLTNYTITYTLNNGTVEPINPENYTVETDAITLNNPVRTGYTFTGWIGDNGAYLQTSVSIAQGSTGNKSYTANWRLNVYTVTFNANGGEVYPEYSTTSTSSLFAWQLTSLPTPTRTGYIFNGWFTADTSGTQVTTLTSFSADTTIYAQWNKTPGLIAKEACESEGKIWENNQCTTPIRAPQIAASQIQAQSIANAIMLQNLPQNAKIEAYNLQGKQIYIGNSGNSQILRIEVQTKGMYVIKVSQGSQKQILRVPVR